MKSGNSLGFYRILISIFILFYLVFEVLLRYFPEIYFPAYFLPFILIPFVTGLIHFVVTRFGSTNFQRFLNIFMITMAFRFFLYLLVILVYLFLNKTFGKQFVFTFLALYVGYTTLELIYLLRYFSKPQNKF